MRTNANYTNEILGGYLMDNNSVNVESLAENIWITAVNTRSLYDDIFNTRRKSRNIAINQLMYWIDENLKYNGYRGYYATNKQVMKWDKEHNNSLEKVLDALVEYIALERLERENEEENEAAATAEEIA